MLIQATSFRHFLISGRCSWERVLVEGEGDLVCLKKIVYLPLISVYIMNQSVRFKARLDKALSNGV